jgi:hypothetical protein
MTCLIFIVLIPLLPQTGSRVIGSNLDGLLLVGSGLVTDLLSRTTSVSYTSSSAIQHHNVLSFAAVVISPLSTFLLVWFLPLLGSQTSVRTNTLRPILWLWLNRVEVDYHFVRDKVAKKKSHIRFIPSQDQLVDVFTKPLPTAPFTAFWAQVSGRSSTFSLRGHIIECNYIGNIIGIPWRKYSHTLVL